MSATVIVLPAVPRPARKRVEKSPAPVADIRIGEDNHMRIYGFTAAEIGLPLVELRGPVLLGNLHLKVEQAEAIAEGLLKAAAKARGKSAI